MLDGWQLVTLGDACADGGTVQTGPFGSQLHAEDYVLDGVPVVMPVNIGDGRIEAQGIARIDEADAMRLARHRLKAGDIVYSRRGDITRRGLVRQQETGWLCGTGCLLVRTGPGVDPNWLSYWLATPWVHDWLRSHAVGATMPNLNTGILSALPVELPSLEEQRRIAGVLGTLDDLIDINRQLGRELDSRLVASWLALARQCDTERVLGELVDLRKGVSYKGAFLGEHGLPLINLANFALDGSFKESGTKHYLGPVKDRQRLSRGSLVVANTDLTQRCEILARPLIVPFEAATSTHHTFQVDVRGSAALHAWVFYALRTEVIRRRLISFATGTTVAALPADALLSQEIPMASDQVIDGWWSKASALREAQESVAAETGELVRARDELLPLLLSGRVRVEDVAA